MSDCWGGGNTGQGDGIKGPAGRGGRGLAGVEKGAWPSNVKERLLKLKTYTDESDESVIVNRQPRRQPLLASFPNPY